METTNEVAVIGVCGAHFPFFIKDKKNANERILLDFAKLYNFFNENTDARMVKQYWFSSVDVKNHCEAFRMFLHEPNDRTTLIAARKANLRTEFQATVLHTLRKYQHIVVVISGHGGEDAGGPYVMIGGMKFYKSRLSYIFSPRQRGDTKATVVMTSCSHSGSWLSQNWTLYTTAVAVKNPSTPHDQFKDTGGIPNSEQIQGDERDGEIQPQQENDSIVRWSKEGTIGQVLSYHELGSIVRPNPTERVIPSASAITPEVLETSSTLERPESSPQSCHPEQKEQSIKETVTRKKQQPSRLDLLVRYYDAGIQFPSGYCSERFLESLVRSYHKGSKDPRRNEELEKELNFRLSYDRKALELLSILGYKASVVEFLAWNPVEALMKTGSSKYTPMLEKWKERRYSRRHCSYSKPLLFVVMILENKLKPSREQVLKAVKQC